ncbi:hypothetical protein LCGC14_1320570, partial [marine sediment metagenome]
MKMGINIKNKAKEPVKDNKGKVKNDKDRDINKDESKRVNENGLRNDTKHNKDIKENKGSKIEINSKNNAKESIKDNIERAKNDKDKGITKDASKRVKENGIKNDIKHNKDIKENNKEKIENNWDKINWKKDISEKKGHSKWDEIDWNKNISENVNIINKIKNPNDRTKENKDDESIISQTSVSHPEEEYFNPNEGNPEGNINLNNQDTVSVVTPEEPNPQPEPKQVPEIVLEPNEEYPEKPEPFTPEALNLMRELEEAGIPIENHLNDEMEYETDLNYKFESEKESLELESELELDREAELESYREVELESDREAELDDKLAKNLEKVSELKRNEENEKIDVTEEKTEELKEKYHQETGGRSIYRGKETRGFIKWQENLEEQNEGYVEEKKLLYDRKEEKKEQLKEIGLSKEGWAQYLAESIKHSEFPEDVEENLSEFLEKYRILKILLEKFKAKEISEQDFKQEMKIYEHDLIESYRIANQLFLNYDWFRRYYNETFRRSRKRVAHLLIHKKTKEFLKYVSGKFKQLKRKEDCHKLTQKIESFKKDKFISQIFNEKKYSLHYEAAENFEEFIEKSFEIREKWALQLKSYIHKVPNKEISKETKRDLETIIKIYCEIRAILFNKNILKEDQEKLMQERIEKCDPRFFELFEILRRFFGIYGYYSRNWMEKSLVLEARKTVKLLSQKLENIKKESTLHQILNEKGLIVQKFKENLKQNLYNNTIFDLKKKSTIIKIIQKEMLSEEDKTKLISVLTDLSIKDLIFLLGDDFRKYTDNILLDYLISNDNKGNFEKNLVIRERRIKISTSELKKIREKLVKKQISFNMLRRIIG